MISPYIKFNGNCKDAMHFYKQCLGGNLYLRMYAESPMACLLNSEVAMKISSGILSNASLTINGSDVIGQQSVHGNAISLFMDCQSEADLKTVFDRLSEDGQVALPVHQTYWGSIRGEFTDKFGIQWILNYSKRKS